MMQAFTSLGGLALLFAAVGVILYLLSRRRDRQLTIRRRLGLDLPRLDVTGGFRRPSVVDQFPWIETLIELFMLDGVFAFYRRLLYRAGYRNPDAPYIFVFIKSVIILAVVLALHLVHHPWQRIFTGQRFPLASLIVIVVVWLYGDMLLWRQVSIYRRKILRDLPFWLDLHTTLLEGGMGFDEALARIYAEQGQSKRPIFDELQQVYRLIHLGSSRAEALRSMSEGLKIEALDVAVACIIQGDQLGVGMANTLRTQAEMVRNQLYEDELSKAQRLPVELVFPMAVAILPSLFLLMVGPPLLQLLEVFRRI